jgi:hypothetical protein
MLEKLMFSCLSENNQLAVLKNKGKILRTHFKNGRRGYLYGLNNFYVEVIYHKDSIDLTPECVKTFRTMDEVNEYLES